MADKTLSELPAAGSLTGEELVLLEQDAEAKKASSGAFISKVAEEVAGAPGFKEQINEGIAEYFDNDPPFFELPSGGQSGQALLSDGNDGAVWGEAGIPGAVKTALLACFRKVMWFDNDGSLYDNLYNALYPESPEPPEPQNTVQVENGAVSVSDGSESDNDMRARTDFIPCTNRVFAVNALINTFNVVSYVARYYDANKQYIGHGDTSGVTPQVFGGAGSGWLAGDGTEYTDATSLTGTVAYVRFLLRTTAGTETVSDVSGTITVDGTEYNVLYS